MDPYDDLIVDLYIHPEGKAHLGSMLSNHLIKHSFKVDNNAVMTRKRFPYDSSDMSSGPR